MTDSAGKIGLDLTINDTRNFNKQIERSGNDAAQNFSKAFDSSFGKLKASAASAFAVAKIVEFGKESVEAAAAVNAENSQLTQTFGKAENAAKSMMRSVADESGILETRLQKTGTSIYAFAKASGMDSNTALTLMQDGLKVTADLAAYYDRSLEDTSESLKAFLKGNYANDAALGISCTETTRNIAANKLYGKSFADLSEAQKQLTLLQMVKDANQLSGAMGQAAREADGWENVTGNLKESWRQLLATVGQPVLSGAVSIVKKLTTGMQKLTAYAKEAVSTISEVFGFKKTDSAVTAAADATSDMSDNAQTTADGIDYANKNANKLKKTLAGFDQLNILQAGNNVADNLADTGGANSAIADFVESEWAAGIEKSGIKLDKFKERLIKIKDTFTKLWNSKGFQNIIAGVKKFIAGAGEDIVAGLCDIVGIFVDLIDLDWDGLCKDIGNLTGHIGSLTGDAAVSLSTMIFGEDSEITKSVQRKLDNWKNALESYGLAGAIASFMKDTAVEALNMANVKGPARDYLSTWWNNCYGVFVNTLKRNNLATAITNVFLYALKTSGPLIESLIVSWGNKIINAYNCIVDITNKMLHANFKKIDNLKLSEESWSKILGTSLSSPLAAAQIGVGNALNIPKMATGGIVRAPTLALVGDNKNAYKDPEVVSPLSKLKGMVSSQSDDRILAALNRLCDLIANQNITYESNIYLDGDRIERQITKAQQRKNRRYGGAY